MPGEYQHIQTYEKERIELWNQGKTLRGIGNMFGFTYKQMRSFKIRYNRNQRVIALKRKGRPSKDYVVSEPDRIAELKYIFTRKEAKIKPLEDELLKNTRTYKFIVIILKKSLKRYVNQLA